MRASSLLLLFATVLSPVYLFAQTASEPISKYFNRTFLGTSGRYLATALAIDSARAAYAGTPDEGMHRYYTGLLDSWFANRTVAPKAQAQLVSSDGIAYVDALAYLDTVFARHSIVMLNEHHVRPRSRALARALLAVAQRHGFRTLSLEGLDAEDSTINKRGYPLITSGFYLPEPEFGHLLRTAIERGFTLYTHEMGDGCDQDLDFSQGVNCRDSIQAANLYRIYRSLPEPRKLLVYCGFDHINEGPRSFDGSNWLAWQLRQRYGLDPYTINQTRYIDQALEAGSPSGYVALLQNGKPYKPADYERVNDLFVAACTEIPEADPLSRVELPVPETYREKADFYAQVFIEKEFNADPRAVPRANFRFPYDRPLILHLAPGVYHLVVRDAAERIVYGQVVEVKRY